MLRFSLALLIALAGVANAQVKSISPSKKNQLHMILEILLGHGIYSSFPFWMSFGMGQKRMNKQIGESWLDKDKM